MRQFATVLVMMALALPGLAQAQDETLADIRQELSVLYVEIQKLKRELSTTGSSGEVAVGGSVISRVDALETEVQRLTGKTEELEFRIDAVVRDGTNRIGDLEFRLCELEADCDIGDLNEGTTLGGVEPATDTAGQTTGTDSTDGGDQSGPQLAVGEQADFDTALATLEAGDYAAAAEQFELFRQNYPGGPLSAQAGMKRGEALEGMGDLKQAGRAYLDVFSANENGVQAPEALYRVGVILGRLDKVDQACVTLGEVGLRFPGGSPAQNAALAMQNLGCP